MHYPDRSSTHRTVDAFVDDTNSGLTTDSHESFNPPTDSPVPKMPKIQAQTVVNVQFYSDLLTSTGGKLALHKSYVYLLQTQWKKGTFSTPSPVLFQTPSVRARPPLTQLHNK